MTEPRPAYHFRRPNKFNARKVELDGYTFDSQDETNRYGELLILEKAGEISHLQVHTVWELLPPFRRGKKRYRGIYYEVDFDYLENGQRVAEDVKGFATAVFRLKEKLFRYKYPDVELRIIKGG